MFLNFYKNTGYKYIDYFQICVTMQMCATVLFIFIKLETDNSGFNKARLSQIVSRK